MVREARSPGGHDVAHTRDIDLRTADDEIILQGAQDDTEAINVREPDAEVVLVATGSYLGESFD